MRIAVTGATGHLGGHVINSLIERGTAPQNIVAIVRDEAKAAPLAQRGVQVAVAPYDDVDALTSALKLADRLLLVSGSEVGQRFAQHTKIVTAAKAAGISYIAYTSLLNLDTSELGLAPEHRATETLIKDSGIEYTFLRNGWYWENYASGLESGKAAGKFFGSAGDAKVSGAARKDYAEAAAAVILSDDHKGKTYELAGGADLTYPDIAAAIGEVLGTAVTYVNLPVAQYQEILEGAGLPAPVAQMFAEMDPIIEKGALYSASGDLEAIIGRAATTAAQALAA